MMAKDFLIEKPTRWWSRVNARFVLVLSLALLPLLVISLFQTNNLQDEAQGRAQQAMLGATLRATTGEVGVIRFAQGAVAALASAPGVVGSLGACNAAMRLTAKSVPTASLVSFVPKSGRMTCSSNGKSYDYSTYPQFKRLIAAQEPMFVISGRGPVSGTSVLLATHPVFDADGNYLGYTTIALPHAKLDGVNKALDSSITGLEMPAQFWTFDSSGEVLTANVGLNEVSGFLPSGQSLVSFVGQPSTVFNDRSVSGESRSYVMVPIVPGELFLMSSWNTRAGRLATRNDLSPYLMPVVMWALGMIVAAWAAEWLVSRHVRVLTRAIGQFARGNRSIQSIDLSEAPAELRDAGNAFLSMADGVMRGEASLEDTIHQKEVLLREVHHRVKNNLQLIASIMNIQIRKAVAPESKALLRSLQDRIMTLATIHRGLYQTSGMVDVRADELLRDIVRQIVNLGDGPGRKFDVDVVAEEVHLTPDQAVPLSLLLTEAMTNAMKYAGVGSDGIVRITVRLRRTEGAGLSVEVENSFASGAEVRARAGAVDGTGLGSQLLTAFTQQLGGKLTRTLSEQRFHLAVEFDIRALASGEDRTT